MNKQCRRWCSLPAVAALALAVWALPTHGQDPAGEGVNGNGIANETDPAAGDASEHEMALELMQLVDPGEGEPTTEPSADATTHPSTQPAAETPPRPGEPPRTLATNRRRLRGSNATPPVDPVRVSKPISKDFAALLTRSVFLKGKQAVVEATPSTGPALPVTEAVHPQRNLVFNGVTESDAAVALLEDATTHRISKLHMGESIAGGKILAIALDSIQYESGGKVLHIQIGQNLEGGTTTPTSGPAVFATEGASTGAGGGSVLEQMRRRRQQELSR